MSTSGFISLSAISVLANPRPIDPQKGSRNIVLDANFFVVEGSQTSCLGLLRYFVPDDMLSSIQDIFQSSFHKAFVVANVCNAYIFSQSSSESINDLKYLTSQISSVTKDAIPTTLLSDEVEITDYAFVGDIVQVRIVLRVISLTSTFKHF
jgi:hypothetical protein